MKNLLIELNDSQVENQFTKYAAAVIKFPFR